MLATKFFSSSHDEDYEAPWLQNPTTYKRSSFFKRKMNWGKLVTGHNMLDQKPLLHVASSVMTLKIILIYVQGSEKRKPKQIYTDMCEISSKKLSFVIQDRQVIYQAVVEHQAEDPFQMLSIKLGVEL